MKITDIIIENRIRKEMGDIEDLKRSISEVGLLHPIVVTKDNCLLCGKRRLEALRQLGITDLKEGTHYRIFDIEDPLRGEFEENFCRKDFSPTEAVEIWEKTESVQGQHPSNLLKGGRVVRVAKSLGVGQHWLTEAKRVKDSGDKHLIEEMDRGDISVHKAYEIVMKNRKPASLYLSKERVDLLKDGKLNQISRMNGNWMAHDVVSVHMSNVASVEIVSVTEKKLQDFTEEDAKSEGYESLFDFKNNWISHNNQWNHNDKVLILKLALVD